MADEVRFGIIGAGRVAHDLAAGLADVPGAKCTAVWSRTRERADAFAATVGTARATDSLEQLLDADDVDAVYVATPHQRHAEDSLAALRAGKAVLCEKPFATSAEEAAMVVAEARRHGRFCMEAMWMRFIPAVQRARSMVLAGDIGEPSLLFADFGVATPYDASSRFYDPAQGGGALLDRGVYAVSLAHFFFGEPVEATAVSTPAPTGVDRDIAALLRFDGGPVALLAASLGSTTENGAVVAGTGGRLRLVPPFYRPDRLELVRDRSGHLQATESTPGRKEHLVARAKETRLGGEAVRLAKRVVRRPEIVRLPITGNGYGYEVAEVVRCVRAGLVESDMMPLDESVAVLRTMDRLRQTSE